MHTRSVEWRSQSTLVRGRSCRSYGPGTDHDIFCVFGDTEFPLAQRNRRRKMFMSMLAALEELTVDGKSLPYSRVFAWWILLQSWGTMRFSDHRGLKPSDVQVTGNTMAAELTRSKTTGDDKDVAFRMVHISSCCYVVSPSWPSTGLTLLKSIADFPRDFLLPAPASNCNGCLRKELRYDIGSAMQNGILSSLQFNGQSSLTRSTPSLCAPHSARSFLPSATAALGVPKDQRDYLGGWSAQGSDSYTRVAARMITNLQKLVIRARQGSSEDPFAEAETSKQLDDHLCSKGYSAEDRERCFKGLDRPITQRPQQELEELRLDEGATPKEAAVEPEPEVQEELRVDPSAKKDKRLKSENTKSDTLGSNPKAARERARSQLQKGCSVSTSGRNSIRVLRRLGACYMVPGIDHLRYMYSGPSDAEARRLR